MLNKISTFWTNLQSACNSNNAVNESNPGQQNTAEPERKIHVTHILCNKISANKKIVSCIDYPYFKKKHTGIMLN